MAVDPAAGLRIWPVTVTVNGRDYTIPALPATDWLVPLLEHPNSVPTWDLFPGLLDDDDQQDIADQLMDGDLQLTDVRDAALDALTVAGGNPWWWTVRIVAAAIPVWDRLYGLLLVGGVDPNRLSLAGFTTALYALAVKDLPQDKQQLLDMDLNQVPEGYEQELDEDTESAAFMRMMEQTQQLPM